MADCPIAAFEDARFKSKLDRAMKKVRTVLDLNKNPKYPEDVQHEYTDKYLLAEFLTNGSIASHLNVLECLGLKAEDIPTIIKWSSDRSVSLRFASTERCEFLREEIREESSVTVETSFLFTTKKEKVITKIPEYFWKFDVEYELVAFVGSDPKSRVVLQKNEGSTEIKTLSKDPPPHPKVRVRDPFDINISWLFSQVSLDRQMEFFINKDDPKCHTPRRNPDIDKAVAHFSALYRWGQNISRYLLTTLFPVQHNNNEIDMSVLNAESIFVPVLPLFEGSPPKATQKAVEEVAPSEEQKAESQEKGEKEKEKEKEGSEELRESFAKGLAIKEGSKVLPFSYMVPFLAEELRSLTEKFGTLKAVLPSDSRLITYPAGRLVVTLQHAMDLGEGLLNGVDYVEDMLRKQLIAAIGKVLTPADFSNYMRFHNRKLFKEDYAPRGYCYAIRRPKHYPEGILSIEEHKDDGSLPQPIETIVARSPPSPFHFALDAATRVTMNAERYIHSWMSTQFSGDSGATLSLNARARQFSSFILVVGRIISEDTLDPKHAIIIRNKDDLKIPLELEKIPTPKQFRDAIKSLSPEQQRFAKAYRSLQLSSTLFGVCVLQIKPQMEKLLRLPDDSLTKEIKLTQELSSLFIEYQIPSDLVSYDGPEGDNVSAKVARVAELASRMAAMINETKSEQLVEKIQKEEVFYDPFDPVESGDEECYFEEESSVDDLLEDLNICAELMPVSCMSAPMAKSSFSAAPKPKPIFAKQSMKNTIKADLKPQSSRQSKCTAKQPAANKDKPKPTPKKQPAAKKDGAKPQKEAKESSFEESSLAVPGAPVRDVTKVPGELDKKYGEFDEDNAVRPTIINIGGTWTKSFQKSLLASPESMTMSEVEQVAAKKEAFDLLDGLTKSGCLSVDQAELHVLVAATHCFDKTLLETVIQDNVNPIEKVERTELIVGTTIHELPAQELVNAGEVARVSKFCPKLFH